MKEIDDCNPIVPYGKSKLEAERILINFYRVNDFPVVIIRSPIVYGPKQKSELTKVFRMIKKGQFKIIGDGENIKSLCYIDNLIQGILLAEKKEGIKGEIYFLADERPYSMNELYQTISHLESVELSKKHIPTFVADLCGVLFDIVNKLFRFSFMPLFTMKTVTLSFACDISKAVRELGYAPQIDLKEGLAKTLEWYKNEVEN